MVRVLLLVLAGLLLAATAAALAFRRDMAAAQAAASGESLLAATRFGPVEYAEAGAGPPVLMIHGSGGGFDQGLAFARPLVAAGFRVIAPSRFGYLRSAMPAAATPQMQADALADLLDRLGIADAVIVGGSAGALSAAQLAIRHPDRCRALVLVVPASHAPDRAPGANAAPRWWPLVEAALGSDLLFWAAIRIAPDALTRMILATDPALVHAADPAERARVADTLFRVLPVSRRRQGLLMDMATAGAPPPYPFDTIACPLVAISAEDDLYATAPSARHAAATAPHGRALVFPTGGHMLVGRQAATWSAVVEAIRSASAR